MSRSDPDRQQRVEQYEAGVSDLIAAYELAEEHYWLSAFWVGVRVASSAQLGFPA